MDSALRIASEYSVLLRQWWWSESRKALVSFQSPVDIWKENPSFLICEIIFLIWGVVTLRHAMQQGGRYSWLWVAALLHGMVTETVSYCIPNVDNFWHAQSMVVFMKQRLPLHIALFYPAVYYTEVVAVSRLRLSAMVEPFAAGLVDVIVDFPFDVMGVKLLWWSWHESDPNIYDRSYHVPWTSYIFHMTFMSSFVILYNLTHRLITGSRHLDHPPGGAVAELVCVVLTGVFSMSLAVALQFIPFYHLLHDLYGVHTELVVMIIFGLYVLISWIGDRHPLPEARPPATTKGRTYKPWYKNWLVGMVTIHFVFYMVLVLLASPELTRSTGVHQMVTHNCTNIPQESIQTILGDKLYRNASLCSTQHRETYFTTNCGSPPTTPGEGSRWYTICGTPYVNKAEYVAMVMGFSLLGLFVFYQLFARSAPPTKRTRKH